MEPKKYGLIHLSKADKKQPKITKNIFDSDSDDDSKTDSKPVTTSSGIRRQTQLDISRALTDDPNVFEYDSIYDEMKSQKQSNEVIDPTAKEKPKPKYINNLLKYSENRKKEMERRVERKIQKEREAEGSEFEDKEQFVTNAYKEKLEEIRLAEERDLKEQAIDELLDVKKQTDLSGFYRNLLNREIDKSSQLASSESKTTTADEPQQASQQTRTSFPKSKSNRQIRERRGSSDESAEEESHKKERTPEPKKRSERRESIKTEDIHQRPSKRERKEDNKRLEDSEDNNRRVRSDKSVSTRKETKRDLKEDVIETEPKVEVKEETENKPKKLDKRELLLKIFTKRTVGQAFEDSQMRYFQRKDNYVI